MRGDYVKRNSNFHHSFGCRKSLQTGWLLGFFWFFVFFFFLIQVMQGHITCKKQVRHTAKMASHSLHTGILLFYLKSLKNLGKTKIPSPSFSFDHSLYFYLCCLNKTCLCELLPWRKPQVWCQWVLLSQYFCPRGKKDLAKIDIPYTCSRRASEGQFAILFRKQYCPHKLQRKYKYATLPNFSKAMRGHR